MLPVLTSSAIASSWTASASPRHARASRVPSTEQVDVLLGFMVVERDSCNSRQTKGACSMPEDLCPFKTTREASHASHGQWPEVGGGPLGFDVLPFSMFGCVATTARRRSHEVSIKDAPLCFVQAVIWRTTANAPTATLSTSRILRDQEAIQEGSMARPKPAD